MQAKRIPLNRDGGLLISWESMLHLLISIITSACIRSPCGMLIKDEMNLEINKRSRLSIDLDRSY